jgi:hypothetical protein
MRRLLLLSIALMLAACADDQHSTAPASSRSASSARSLATGNVAAPSRGVTPLAKPSGQIGFSQVAIYASVLFVVPADGNVNQFLECPTGTTATGGGYRLNPSSLDHPPFVHISGPESNGWRVQILNSATGSTQASFTIFVSCAS